MTVLGEAVVKIRTDDSGLDKDFDNIRTKAEGMGGVLKTALATAGGFVIAQGFMQLPGLISDVVGKASNMNETVSKTNTIFKDSTNSVREWGAGSAKDFGLSEQAALDAASSFGNMFTQLGIGTEEAAGMSMGITELAADFASFHNADISEVINAQSAAFRGEYDSLQRFLPLINAATVEQKALEMTGKASAKALTAQEKALAVNALMLQGAGEAMGDFDRTSGGLANRQRILAAEFENLQGRIGQGLLPIVVAVAGFLLDTFIPAIEKGFEILSNLAGPTVTKVIDFLKNLVDSLSGVSDTLKTGLTEDDVATPFERMALTLRNVITVVIEVVKNVIAFYTEVAKAVLAGVQWAEKIGLLDAILQGIVTIVNIVASAIQAFTGFMAEHNTIAAALAIVLGLVLVALFPIPAAILAVVAIVGILSKNWDEIKSKTESVWNAIPGPIQAAIEFALSVIQTFIDGVTTYFDGLVQVITGAIALVSAIFSGDWNAAWQAAQQIADGVVKMLTGMIQMAFPLLVTIIKTAIDEIPGVVEAGFNLALSAATGLANTIVSTVSDIISGLPGVIGGFIGEIPGVISGGIDAIVTAATNLANSIINAIKNTLRNFRISGSIGGVDLGPLGTTPSVSVSLQPFSFLAKGTPLIPFDDFPAMLHKNEAVIPARFNPFNPTNDLNMGRGLKGLNSENINNMTITLHNPTIIATDKEAAMQSINDIGLAIGLRSRGEVFS